MRLTLRDDGGWAPSQGHSERGHDDVALTRAREGKGRDSPDTTYAVIFHPHHSVGPLCSSHLRIMSHEESISLEETNKIRISLGLKPLTDDKAPTDNKEKQAEDNYAKRREEEAKEREKK